MKITIEISDDMFFNDERFQEIRVLENRVRDKYEEIQGYHFSTESLLKSCLEFGLIPKLEESLKMHDSYLDARKKRLEESEKKACDFIEHKDR